MPRQPRPHGHRHPHAADRRPEARAEDLRRRASIALGWVVDEMDEFVIHQVSQVHTAAFVKAFGIDPKKVLTIFNEHGNIGPASVPIVLSQAARDGPPEEGRPHRAARHRLGPELLDGRSRLVSQRRRGARRAVSRLPVHTEAVRRIRAGHRRMSLPRRRPARRRSRGHAARQSVVELLLAPSGARPARPATAASCPTTSAWACRTSPTTTALRLHAAVARRRPRRAARPPGHRRPGDAGRARLGRHDRLRLGAGASPRRSSGW